MAGKQPKDRAPFIVPGWVRDAGLDPALFRVLSQVVSRCGDGGECWESANSMAASCGLDRKTCMRCIGELEQMGLIAVEKRNGVRNTTRMRRGWQQVLESRSNRSVSHTGPIDTPVGELDMGGPNGTPDRSVSHTATSPNGSHEGIPLRSSFKEPSEGDGFASEFSERPDLAVEEGRRRKKQSDRPLVEVETGRGTVRIKDEGPSQEEIRKRGFIDFMKDFKTRHGRAPDEGEIPAALRRKEESA